MKKKNLILLASLFSFPLITSMDNVSPIGYKHNISKEQNKKLDSQETTSLSNQVRTTNEGGVFSKQLSSNEKTYIDTGTTGPRGILLPTNDYHVTYFDNSGNEIWTSEKSFQSTSNTAQKFNQIASSVYANNKFYVLYFVPGSDANYSPFRLCVIDEKTGSTLTELPLGTSYYEPKINSFNLINVDGTENYIIFVARSNIETACYKITFIETINNTIAAQLFKPGNSFDMITSISAKCIGNQIYFAFIYIEKSNHNNKTLNFYRMNINTNNIVNLIKGDSLSINVPWNDWPEVDKQTVKLVMNVIEKGNGAWEASVRYVNTWTSEKSITTFNFDNNTQGSIGAENIQKISLGPGEDLNVTFNNSSLEVAKIINNDIYLWVNESWVTDVAPHIIRINGNEEILPDTLTRNLRSNQLEWNYNQAFLIDDALNTSIFSTTSKNSLEFVDSTNQTFKIKSIPVYTPDTSSPKQASDNNLMIIIIAAVSGVVIILIVVIIFLLVRISKNKKKKLKNIKKPNVGPRNNLLTNSSPNVGGPKQIGNQHNVQRRNNVINQQPQNNANRHQPNMNPGNVTPVRPLVGGSIPMNTRQPSMIKPTAPPPPPPPISMNNQAPKSFSPKMIKK